MSSMIQNNTLLPFYGTVFSSTIKNVDDFLPLSLVLGNLGVFPIKKVMYKFGDIFCQSLEKYKFKQSKVMKKWLIANNYELDSNEFPPPTCIIAENMNAVSGAARHFPDDFKINSKDAKIVIKNNKVLIRLNFDDETIAIFKNVIREINSIYGMKRALGNKIIVGYIPEGVEISEKKIEILNSLIPGKIHLNYPSVYHHSSVNKYVDFREKLY